MGRFLFPPPNGSVPRDVGVFPSVSRLRIPRGIPKNARSAKPSMLRGSILLAGFAKQVANAEQAEPAQVQMTLYSCFNMDLSRAQKLPFPDQEIGNKEGVKSKAIAFVESILEEEPNYLFFWKLVYQFYRNLKGLCTSLCSNFQGVDTSFQACILLFHLKPSYGPAVARYLIALFDYHMFPSKLVIFYIFNLAIAVQKASSVDALKGGLPTSLTVRISIGMSMGKTKYLGKKLVNNFVH